MTTTTTTTTRATPSRLPFQPRFCCAPGSSKSSPNVRLQISFWASSKWWRQVLTIFVPKRAYKNVFVWNWPQQRSRLRLRFGYHKPRSNRKRRRNRAGGCSWHLSSKKPIRAIARRSICSADTTQRSVFPRYQDFRVNAAWHWHALPRFAPICSTPLLTGTYSRQLYRFLKRTHGEPPWSRLIINCSGLLRLVFWHIVAQTQAGKNWWRFTKRYPTLCVTRYPFLLVSSVVRWEFATSTISVDLKYCFNNLLLKFSLCSWTTSCLMTTTAVEFINRAKIYPCSVWLKARRCSLCSWKRPEAFSRFLRESSDNGKDIGSRTGSQRPRFSFLA